MREYCNPLDCPDWVDVSGMPMQRGILVTDHPQRTIVALCPVCGVQHRVVRT